MPRNPQRHTLRYTPSKQKRQTLKQALAALDIYARQNPGGIARCPEAVDDVLDAYRRETQAAPALLEALRAMMYRFESFESADIDDQDFIDARAAIAAATEE